MDNPAPSWDFGAWMLNICQLHMPKVFFNLPKWWAGQNDLNTFEAVWQNTSSGDLGGKKPKAYLIFYVTTPWSDLIYLSLLFNTNHISIWPYIAQCSLSSMYCSVLITMVCYSLRLIIISIYISLQLWKFCYIMWCSVQHHIC